MLKTITKIGNSQGRRFEVALCELTGLKPGDQINVTVHDGGSVVITPVRKSADPAIVKDTVRKVVKDYRRTLRKLA